MCSIVWFNFLATPDEVVETRCKIVVDLTEEDDEERPPTPPSPQPAPQIPQELPQNFQRRPAPQIPQAPPQNFQREVPDPHPQPNPRGDPPEIRRITRNRRGKRGKIIEMIKEEPPEWWQETDIYLKVLLIFFFKSFYS